MEFDLTSINKLLISHENVEARALAITKSMFCLSPFILNHFYLDHYVLIGCW